MIRPHSIARRTVAALCLGVLAAAASAADAGLTRAEVKADLALYQQAGLNRLVEQDEAPWSEDFVRAQRLYEQWRASPRRDELIQRYSAHPASETK